MKELYLSQYKCRLCGEIYSISDGLFDLSEAAIEVWVKRSNIMSLTGTHICKNGAIGVSDLQGLVPKKE